MGYIKDVQIGNNTHLIEPILYAITAGDSSNITAQISNFDLQSGVIVTLKITSANTAGATLNISSTGEKEIKYNGQAIQTGILKQNKIYSFVYDSVDNNNNGAWLLISEIFSKDESFYALTNEVIPKTIFNNNYGALLYASNAGEPTILRRANDYNNTSKTYVLKLNSNGLPNWEEEYSYTLEPATTTKLGGIKIGYSTNAANRNYAIELSNGQAYVNVPWTDTLYGVAANSSLSVTQNIDQQSNKFLFSHNVAYNVATDTVTENINTENTINLQFSDTFNIPKISYDSNGHITKVDLATFSLPSTTDEKVKQEAISNGNQAEWHRLLLGYTNTRDLSDTNFLTTNQAYFYQSLAADANTGTLRANRYRVLNNVDIEWNTTDESLDFIFI